MNCSVFPENCGALQPNSDIAGIGVYISFIASAGITLVAVLLRFFTYKRTKYPDLMLAQWIEELKKYDAYIPPSGFAERLKLNFWVGKAPSELPIEPSREMIFLYKHVPRPLAESLDNSLVSLIIGLADQQAAVALAILIAAALEWETISAYHFNFIASLAWFSCFTHALTLMSLTQWIKRSMFLLWLRLILFSAVFVMYLWAQAVARDYVVPFSGVFAIITMFRVGSLSLVVLLIAGRLLNDWYQNCWQETTSKKSRTCSNLIKVGLSMALFIGVFGGVTGVAFVRDTSSYNGLEVSQAFIDQNSWAFGQIVPMILLILPLIVAVEGLVDERKGQRDEQKEEQNKSSHDIEEQENQQSIPLLHLPRYLVNIGNVQGTFKTEVPLLRHISRAETR